MLHISNNLVCHSVRFCEFKDTIEEADTGFLIVCGLTGCVCVTIAAKSTIWPFKYSDSADLMNTQPIKTKHSSQAKIQTFSSFEATASQTNVVIIKLISHYDFLTVSTNISKTETWRFSFVLQLQLIAVDCLWLSTTERHSLWCKHDQDMCRSLMPLTQLWN